MDGNKVVINGIGVVTPIGAVKRVLGESEKRAKRRKNNPAFSEILHLYCRNN